MDSLENTDVELQFVSVPQACEILPISVSNLYQRIKDKKIPAVMFGKRIFLRRSVLDVLKTAGTAPYDQLAVPKETD
jgi:excisionase family DNA binding protein